MTAALIGFLASLVITPLIMAGLRAAFPAKVAAEPGRSLEELTRDYKKWDYAAIPLVVVSGLVTFFFLYHTLRFAGGLLPRLFPDALLVWAPSDGLWMGVALFMSLALSVLPLLWLYRLLLGQRCVEFFRYSALRYRIAPRAYGWLLAGYLTLCSAFLVLVADWTVRFTESALIDSPFWSLSDALHPYTDVASIVTAPKVVAPNGNVVLRREYTVRFRDGSFWTTNLDPSGATLEEKREALELVARKSGVPLTELPVLAREDLY